VRQRSRAEPGQVQLPRGESGGASDPVAYLDFRLLTRVHAAFVVRRLAAAIPLEDNFAAVRLAAVHRNDVANLITQPDVRREFAALDWACVDLNPLDNRQPHAGEAPRGGLLLGRPWRLHGAEHGWNARLGTPTTRGSLGTDTKCSSALGWWHKSCQKGEFCLCIEHLVFQTDSVRSIKLYLQIIIINFKLFICYCE
jgi:hypothetical protein